MPLPQQVINQLSREPAETPGWSVGVMFFSAGFLIILLLIYFGMTLAYEPYLNGQISSVNNKTQTLSQSISSPDQANLLTFYSQIANLQMLLKHHIVFPQFLSWLGQNTEANIYYSSFSFSSGNELTLTGNAKTESDINQQIAIFQVSPEVQKVVVSNINPASTGGGLQFSATVLMNQSIFIASSTP